MRASSSVRVTAPGIAASVTLRLRGDPLFRNSLYIMATTVANSLIGFGFWAVAAHLFQAGTIGFASALVSAVALCSTFSNLGIGFVMVQLLPSKSDGESWSSTVNAGLFLTVCSGIVGAMIMVEIFIFLPALGMSALVQQPAYLAALVSGVVLWNLSTLLDQIFVAERAARHMFIRNVSNVALRLGLLIVPLLLASLGVLAILTTWFGAMMFATVVAFLVLIPRLNRAYRPMLRSIGGALREVLSLLAGHYLITVGSFLPVYLLPLVVTARLSPVANAYFYTTWMVASVFFMVSPAVATALFAEGAHTRKHLARRVGLSMALIAVLLGMIAIGFIIAGYRVLAVFGPAYAAASGPLLLPLAIASVPDAITNLYVSVQRIHRHLGRAAVLNIGMGVLAVVLAWFLVPQIGIAGAGWAWLAAQTAGTVFALAAILIGRLVRRPSTAAAAAASSPVAAALPIWSPETWLAHDAERALAGPDWSLYTADTVATMLAIRAAAPQASHEPFLVVRVGDGAHSSRVPIRSDSVSIGRGVDCTLRLLDPSISRLHATIRRDEHGQYVLRDEHSTNGTFVNGRSISSHVLRDGDVIAIQGDTLTFGLPHPRQHAARRASAADRAGSDGSDGSNEYY